MSMNVLIIALIHGMPVALVGFLTTVFLTRAPMYVTAAIMCAVAVLIGRPEYAVLDLLGVALGVFVGSKLYAYMSPSPGTATPSIGAGSQTKPRDDLPRPGDLSERAVVSLADELYDQWIDLERHAGRAAAPTVGERKVVRDTMKSLFIAGKFGEPELLALMEIAGENFLTFYLLMCNMCIARGWMTQAHVDRFMRNYEHGYEEGLAEARAMRP